MSSNALRNTLRQVATDIDWDGNEVDITSKVRLLPHRAAFAACSLIPVAFACVNVAFSWKKDCPQL